MLQPLRRYSPHDAGTQCQCNFLAIVKYYPTLTLTSRTPIHTSCLPPYHIPFRLLGSQPHSAVMMASHLVQCLRKLFTTAISLTWSKNNGKLICTLFMELSRKLTTGYVMCDSPLLKLASICKVSLSTPAQGTSMSLVSLTSLTPRPSITSSCRHGLTARVSILNAVTDATHLPMSRPQHLTASRPWCFASISPMLNSSQKFFESLELTLVTCTPTHRQMSGEH